MWLHIGPDGAGHYVKNGPQRYRVWWHAIDRRKLWLDATLAWPFLQKIRLKSTGGNSRIDSYLIENSWYLELVKRPRWTTVDWHLDAAGNKGTGKWIQPISSDLVPLSLITESVFARYISTYKEERVHASKVLPKTSYFQIWRTRPSWIGKVRSSSSFLLSKIISYAQGFAIIACSFKENNWNPCHLADIASIRDEAGSSVLVSAKITCLSNRDADLANLLLDNTWYRQVPTSSSWYRSSCCSLVKLCQPSQPLLTLHS